MLKDCLVSDLLLLFWFLFLLSVFETKTVKVRKEKNIIMRLKQMKSELCLQKLSKQLSIPVVVVFTCLDHQWILSLDHCSDLVRLMSPSCFTSCACSGIQESMGIVRGSPWMMAGRRLPQS